MPSRLISFKNNELEAELLKEVDRACDKSAFVKECIKFYLNNRDKNFTSKEYQFTTKDKLDDDIEWDFD